MMKALQTWLLSAGLLSAVTVRAHDGHGEHASGLWHYLAEPLHQVALLAVLLGGGALLFMLWQLRRQYRPEHGGQK